MILSRTQKKKVLSISEANFTSTHFHFSSGIQRDRFTREKVINAYSIRHKGEAFTKSNSKWWPRTADYVVSSTINEEGYSIKNNKQ